MPRSFILSGHLEQRPFGKHHSRVSDGVLLARPGENLYPEHGESKEEQAKTIYGKPNTRTTAQHSTRLGNVTQKQGDKVRRNNRRHDNCPLVQGEMRLGLCSAWSNFTTRHFAYVFRVESQRTRQSTLFSTRRNGSVRGPRPFPRVATQSSPPHALAACTLRGKRPSLLSCVVSSKDQGRRDDRPPQKALRARSCARCRGRVDSPREGLEYAAPRAG